MIFSSFLVLAATFATTVVATEDTSQKGGTRGIQLPSRSLANGMMGMSGGKKQSSSSDSSDSSDSKDVS
jgi:hypothetical protein